MQDVIGRIRFDAALDVSRFTVGYEERFAGVREAPLAGVLGEGEVPWHRIWFIKAGSLVVWDRRERIDLILGSGASPAADLAAVQRACAPEPAPVVTATRSKAGAGARFVPQPCFRFDRMLGEWVAHDTVDAAVVAPESLQVVTYNVLFDLYEAEHIYSEQRRVACIELLRAREADIIALQEVTPQLWAQLLATPWVQDAYYVSAGPDAGGLVPYGQALLSRWPLALEVHAFSAQKRLLVGRLALAGRSLAVAAVHLTSNHKADALDKRREQLDVLTQWLAREPGDALVLGDFNFGDGDENPRLAAAGLVDAWQAVHPHHPGFTFDPVANPLAALNSRTGNAARYDRVLLYSPGRALAPIDIT
ncbi:MAG TPA: RNA repair domain-containing protein, partial [Nannocystis sp.]